MTERVEIEHMFVTDRMWGKYPREDFPLMAMFTFGGGNQVAAMIRNVKSAVELGLHEEYIYAYLKTRIARIAESNSEIGDTAVREEIVDRLDKIFSDASVPNPWWVSIWHI